MEQNIRPEEVSPILDEGTARPIVKITASNQSIKNGFLRSNEVIPQEFTSNRRGIMAQCLVAGAIFLLSAGCGFPIGYSAILLPQLRHPNSTLPTNEDLGSWIASVHSAATPVGSFMSGVLMDRWGRRLTLQICTLPFTVGWLMLAFAQDHGVVLAGRVLCGIGVGLAAAPAQVFLGEVAEPRLRGLLAGTPYVSYSLGILMVYALGASLDWHIVAGLGTILPLISLVAFTFLPESPTWLVRNNRKQEAGKALVWLRGDRIQGKRELQQLVARIRAEEGIQQMESVCGSQKTISGSQKNIGGSRKSIGGSQKILGSIKKTLSERKLHHQSCWNDFTQPEILKPFIIVNVFNMVQVVCGTYLLIFYAVDLIKETNKDDAEGIDEFLVAVLTAVIRLVFICVSCVLLFWVGRRPLAIVSGVGSSAAALALGTYFYVIAGTPNTIVTGGLILLYVATNTIGFFVLPGIAISELLPAKVRGSAGGYIWAAFNLALFFITKVFPGISYNLGSAGVFMLFGGASLAGTVFVYLYLPETRGRTLEEVEDYFKESNLMWQTRKRKPVAVDVVDKV